MHASTKVRNSNWGRNERGEGHTYRQRKKEGEKRKQRNEREVM